MLVKTISATELARNLRQVLDQIQTHGEELIIERNHAQVARLIPGPGRQNALEAMSDLYRTLSPQAAEHWLKDSQSGPLGQQSIDENARDPWGS